MIDKVALILLLLTASSMKQVFSFKLLQHFNSKRFSMSMKATVQPTKLNAVEMGNLFRHIIDLNVAPEMYSTFYTLMVSDQVLGYLQPSFVVSLRDESEDHLFFDDDKRVIQFSSHLNSADADAISSVMATMMGRLKDSGKVKGWRNELLPVVSKFGEKPIFLLERAAVPYFGVKAYGVHINGFIRCQETGSPSQLWVARRSKNKSTWPGMLDHIVAGGQPHGLGLMENVIKECEEEASIPMSLAARARPTGAISYNGLDERGNLKRDALFCYDLELPKDFQPRPLDGEVENFELRDIAWVLDRLLATEGDIYKPNCNLVIIDFFIRHGLIDPESPRYLELVAALRTPDCK